MFEVAEAAGSKAEFKTAERGKLIAKPARALSADEALRAADRVLTAACRPHRTEILLHMFAFRSWN